MDPLAALAAGRSPADATLAGYPVGWLRAGPTWDTGWIRLEAHLLYLVDAGRMTLDTGSGPEPLDPGHLALVPPGTRFRARAGTSPPAFWRLRLQLPSPWGGPRVIPGRRDLEPVVSRLVAECSEPPSPLRAAAVRGGLLVLLAALRRGADPSERGLTRDQRRLLERHADADPRATPRDLMRQLGLTLDYGTRLFRTAFGKPPRRWLLERRMHAAAVRVAEGDEPIARIAEDLGFADARLFGRQFRAVLGQPPQRFRDTLRRSADRP